MFLVFNPLALVTVLVKKQPDSVNRGVLIAGVEGPTTDHSTRWNVYQDGKQSRAFSTARWYSTVNFWHCLDRRSVAQRRDAPSAGNTFKGCKVFCLKAKARIWP